MCTKLDGNISELSHYSWHYSGPGQIRMSVERPWWWNKLLPWRDLTPRLPLATVPKNRVKGLVVHRQGQYGWNTGNWVTGEAEGEAVHYGLDIIGWLGGSGPHSLDQNSICCSPLEGVVAWVGPDEHGYPSINLRHSSRVAGRRRFSFFGDLAEVYVRVGQSVSAGTPLGRPAPFREGCRFFHFALGYEVRRNGKWLDVFIDPGPCLRRPIVVRPALPWRKIARG